MDGPAVLLLATVAFLTIYLVGVGGTTATAIRAREAWRHRGPAATVLGPPTKKDVVLSAPTLPSAVRRLRFVGWVAFPIALVLALISSVNYSWVLPLSVILMVAINAFYFTSMQTMGEQLTLTADGFRMGTRKLERSVRWVHVTEFTGARIGAFSGMKMSEAGEWQDPKLAPNVVFYRLNRALVHTNKTLVQRLTGFSYYDDDDDDDDGVIRNAFGVPTEQLLNAMRAWHRQALEAEGPPFRRPRAGEHRKQHGSPGGAGKDPQ